MTQDKSQITPYQTTIRTNKKGMTEVVYYQTAVVTFDATMIILNTGGWRTRSTKMRMNQASQQFDLGYRIFQKESIWHLEYLDETHLYEEERLKLSRKTGEVTSLT